MESNLRLFIAVPIPYENQEKLNKLIEKFKELNIDVKWVKKENLHITLKFLGNTNIKKIKDIENSLSYAVSNINKFKISFYKIDTFPNPNRPRIIWTGIEKGKEKLIFLSKQIDETMKNYGFPKDKKPFHPHVTLGRVRSTKNIIPLKKMLNIYSQYKGQEIEVKEIHLIKSTLTKKGPIYSMVKKIVL